MLVLQDFTSSSQLALTFSLDRPLHFLPSFSSASVFRTLLVRCIQSRPSTRRNSHVRPRPALRVSHLPPFCPSYHLHVFVIIPFVLQRRDRVHHSLVPDTAHGIEARRGVGGTGLRRYTG